jgi:superfamily I DNA/RNA helicase
MALICRYNKDLERRGSVLEKLGIPTVCFRDATYSRQENKVTLITMHSCKGLEFPLVVIPGTDKLKRAEELAPQEAKLLYVAMTRATKELVLCGVGE